MTLNFDPVMTLKECQWRQNNQWKPRSLTSTVRKQYLANKNEQDSGAAANVANVDASYIATQLARQEDRSGNKAEGRREHRGSHVRSAGPVQKVAVQPSILMFGQNGTERLRMTRCHSADHQEATRASSRFGMMRSSGSPYLEEQHVQPSASPRHHQQHHQQRRDHHHQQMNLQHQEKRKVTATGQTAQSSGWRHNHDDKMISPRRHNHDEKMTSPRRPSHDDKSTSPRRHSDDDRIGRCQPGATTPFYKAALALMQAQWQRTTMVQIPHSSATRTPSAQLYPAPSPRGAVQRDSLQQPHPQLESHTRHHHHHLHPHHHHRQPKSILRHPLKYAPGDLSPRSPKDYSLQHSLSSSQPQHQQQYQHPRMVPASVPHSLRLTPRKKVTFGTDVIVQLQPDTGMTGRILSHLV